MLNKVFVTSTKDGETKYLEAKLQDTQYITDDYFDPSNTNYVPGTIAVAYTKKAVTVTDSNTVDGINLSLMKQQLESQGISLQGGITTADDGSINAKVVLGEYSGGMGDAVVDASISELTSSAGINNSEVQKWAGVYNNLATYGLKGTDGKDYTLYFTNKDWSDADTYVMLVKDVSGDKYTKIMLKKAGLKDIAENLSHVNTVADTYLILILN